MGRTQMIAIGPLAVGSNLLPVNIFAAAVIIVAGATAALSLRKK
jgi:hypothetical protein